MIIRENSIKEIADRAYTYFTDESKIIYTGFELVHFELTPIESITAAMMPAILFLEGEDKVIARSSRNHLGYPLTRTFDFIGEVWVHDSDPREKVIAMYRAFRTAAIPLGGILQSGAAVREVQTLGPFAETHEGSMGMRIVLEILYKDNDL